MEKVSRSILIIIFVAIVGVAWSALFSSKKVWHYRMTVVVETPEGLKSGSVVREVTYYGTTRGGGGSGLSLKCRGEAVVVDLGERGRLFALLGGSYCSDVLLRAFHGGATLDPGKVPKEGKVTLTPENYPTFARFSDERDPKTVENLTEIRKRGAFEIQHRLDEKKFGNGVRLVEITIEMTPDPITEGLIERLPWLPDYRGKMLDGARYNFLGSKYPFANSLSAGAFTTETRNGR